MSTEPSEGYHLSPQQQRLWRLQRATTPQSFRAQCMVMIEGQLNARCLDEATRDVVTRHEILRTTFICRPGISMPLQVVARECSVSLPVSNWIERDEDGQVLLLDAFWREFGEQPFDLGQGPLLRLALHRLAEKRHALFVALPALHADEVGLNNLVSEIARAYVARAEGKMDADEPTPYAVFAEWQNELLEMEDAAAGREFWRSRDLSSLPQTRLYGESQVADVAEFAPHSVCAALPAPLAEGLDTLADIYKVRPAAALLACWQMLLSRLTSQPTVVVAVGCDGRSDEELSRALGLFIKYAPVVGFVEPEAHFADLLASVSEAMNDAYDWQECFTWDLLADSGERRGASFFPHAFDYAEHPAPIAANDVSFRVARRYACADRFKLQLSCRREGGALRIDFCFDPQALDADDVERVARWYRALLGSALARPEAPVGALDMLDEEERRQVLYDFNDTHAIFHSDKRVHRLVEEQMERTPEAAAVVFGDECLSYRELNTRANRLAHYLRSLGVGPESVVGIFVERSVEMVVGLLGALKAGGAYLPLDPTYPKARISLIMQDARPYALLTQRRFTEALQEHALPVVVLDDERPPFAAESAETPAVSVADDNLSYVIYTSGSTGKPKGVMISHRAITNRLLWMQTTFPLVTTDHLLQKTSISFDASVWELFTPLMAGATLVVASPGGHQDPTYLVRAAQERDVTVLQLVPSMLRYFLAEPEVARCVSLKRVFCGGETLPSELQERFYTLLVAELHNLYGPTEVSIDATTQACAPGSDDVVVPIGKPLANVQVYLLNEYQQPVAVGMEGELYVGGVGLARGYQARPDLTAERFVPAPFSQKPGTRLYRTGDLARYREDGAIEFLGRTDHQVKVRGFRVELPEIESALKAHPGVSEAVAVAREIEQGDQQIIAYVVPSSRDGRTNGNHPLYNLPNNLEIAHLNKNETDLLYNEIFDNEEYLKHGVTLANSDCIFDVGANIGLFTLFVHSKCAGAQVFSFEPSPPTFDVLRTNIEIYGLNVKLYQCALSDRAGSARFTFYPQVSASSGLYANVAEDAAVTRAFIQNQGELGRYADELLEGRFESIAYTCQLRTLSDVIQENRIERIDLLKVDVEKSELDVLRGITEADWPKIRQLVIEAHDTGGRLQAITELLERHGFRYHIDQRLLFQRTGLHIIYAIHPSRVARRNGEYGKNRNGGRQLLPIAGVAVSVSGLRQYLSERMPDYMAPGAIVMLDKLPLTPNGKVDRQALPAPELAEGAESGPAATPRTLFEEMVIEVLTQVLKRERVGVRDNFFEIGGHSLLAT